MDQPFFKNIAVVGVGLLGGSLAMAARDRKLCETVTGIGRSETSLAEAVQVGAVDRVTTNLEKGVADADLIVLCTPIQSILSMLPRVMAAAKPGAMVTDVGSTKESIVREGEATAAAHGRLFVGSHPMAGSEKSGVRFARTDLFKDTTCFVTKTAQTDLGAFSMVCGLWRALETRTVVLRPERHDRLAGLVSHLPHVLAVALVRAVDLSGEDKNLVKGIIGNGFRSTTRVAAGNTQMWEDICGDNKTSIVEMQALFQKALDEVLSTMDQDQGAALRDTLKSAAEYREFLDQR
jgi:prephenate dehydrogenase